MTHPQYEDPNDRDLLPPQRPMNPLAKLARILNHAVPRIYAAASLVPRLAVSLRWIRKLEGAGAGRRLSALDFGQARTSDTIFVLGTGASINEYPEEAWATMRAHDSIGMNFFLLHDHVPTFHVMEDVHGIRAKLLSYRYVERGDYRDVPLVVKTHVSNLSSSRVGERIDELLDLDPEVRASVYLSLDLLAPGRTIADMESSYRTLTRLGLWKQKRRFLMLTKRRGSVTYVINLAVRAGYRRIVLCGVDLNHAEYFYDSLRAELEEQGIPVPINDQTGAVHDTNDPDVNPVTVHDVITSIKRTNLDPIGVELLVGSRTSALYPELDLFDWSTASGQPDDGD